MRARESDPFILEVFRLEGGLSEVSDAEQRAIHEVIIVPFFFAGRTA
jgi:hypothetical protein